MNRGNKTNNSLLSYTISTESLVDSSVWGEEKEGTKEETKGREGEARRKEKLKAWDNEKESVKELINYQREEAALKSETRISE